MPAVLRKLRSSKECAYCHKAIRKGTRAVALEHTSAPTDYLHQICWDRRNAPSGVVGKKK